MKRFLMVLGATAAMSVACDESTGNSDQPDYGLLLAPGTLSVNLGATPTVSVTIERTNFTGGVALFLTGAPANVSGTFVPTTTTSTSSTLTVTVGGGTTPGVYALVVNGNGAPGPRTAPLSLTVAPAPNFAIEVTPPRLTIARGSSDSTAIAIVRSNFNSSVSLAVDGLPAGATGVFNPAATSGGSSVLTLTVGASVASGTHPLTVTGSSSLGPRVGTMELIVPP